MPNPATRTKTTVPSRRQEGQGLAEYALILALIAMLAIGATQLLGGQIGVALAGVGDQLSGVVSGDAGPDPTVAPTPIPPDAYSTKKTCVAAGYQWVKTPKPNHCE